MSVAARQPTGVSRERDELLDARRRQALLREKLLAAAQAGARVGAEERELDKREAALLPLTQCRLHRGQPEAAPLQPQRAQPAVSTTS